MKFAQARLFFAAVSLGTTALAISGALVPAKATTLTTGAGGGSGFVTNDYSPGGELIRFLDNPFSFLGDLNYFQINGVADVDQTVLSAGGATLSSSQVTGPEGLAEASLTFENNTLKLKTSAEGTVNGLVGRDNVTGVGETAVGYGAAVLKDRPTLSTTQASGSGFYQLLFNLTGAGVSATPDSNSLDVSAFGALAIRNNGSLVIPGGYQRFTGGQTFQTGLLPVAFGQTFNLDIAFVSAIAATCLSLSNCVGPISASADFFNTLTLTGVNVFNGNGQKVDNFTFRSESGLLYAGSTPLAAVPTPSLLFGIIGWGVATLRASRRGKGDESTDS